MSIIIGTTEINDLFLGSGRVGRVYIGTQLVYMHDSTIAIVNSLDIVQLNLTDMIVEIRTNIPVPHDVDITVSISRNDGFYINSNITIDENTSLSSKQIEFPGNIDYGDIIKATAISSSDTSVAVIGSPSPSDTDQIPE